MTSKANKSCFLFFVILLGVLIPILGYALIAWNDANKPLWFLSGKVSDHGNYLLYLPDGLEPGVKYPLVFALSPSADALVMIRTWCNVAEAHHWIVAASKTFRNGQDFGPSMQAVLAELGDAEQNYPVDTHKIIFTGISGGGMGSHGMAKWHPEVVSAIVINTGMMAEGSGTPDYPNGKIAIFLASPSDFRYNEMKRDRQFLVEHYWRTKWIEFSGGHTLAPPEVYDQAADWLEKNLQ